MTEKINAARIYVANGGDINDASNIYADNFEEYMTIWNTLKEGR